MRILAENFILNNRDVKLRQSTVHRLEEVEQQLKLESIQRVENEKDSRLTVESLENKVKLYTDESTDTVRQMVSVRDSKLSETDFILNVSILSIKEHFCNIVYAVSTIS